MMNKLSICLLILLCGCSGENVIDSSKIVSIHETASPSPTSETSKILKEESLQTVTTSNNGKLQFLQFESVFIMEMNTNDLPGTKELDEFDNVSKLKVQYNLTSKKFGYFSVFDVTNQEKALYECEVKNNVISEIKVYSLDITKDPNRLMELSEELFSIIQEVIVFDENKQ